MKPWAVYEQLHYRVNNDYLARLVLIKYKSVQIVEELTTISRPNELYSIISNTIKIMTNLSKNQFIWEVNQIFSLK